MHGSPEECREHVQRYVDNGVTTPALAILPFPGIDQRQAIRDLAPRSARRSVGSATSRGDRTRASGVTRRGPSR